MHPSMTLYHICILDVCFVILLLLKCNLPESRDFFTFLYCLIPRVWDRRCPVDIGWINTCKIYAFSNSFYAPLSLQWGKTHYESGKNKILRPGDSSVTCKKISLLALGKSLKRAEEWFTHLYYLELGALTLALLKISNSTTY